ncbi:MAG: hypothetical protein EHM71_02610 [Zetaproteobacteria bacterium]|nr:MAG: hypothetical protein EHM71_02610 [Zetaproteobacteria bacterium]
MRYLLLAFLIGLALVCELGLFIATFDDGLDSFDPSRPATLLPIISGGLREIRSQVREFDAQHLFEVVTAPYRERLQRTLPAEPLPQ